jgi:glycosyltransferase involved in cell wall biosynthesis
LILLGVEARIATLYQYPETNAWKCYTSPMIFKNSSDLINNLPNTDILIATHWSTAQWVADISKNMDSVTTAYFLQDYESWFFPAEDKVSRNKVLATYPLIDNKIVKSDWLKNLLLNDGYESQKIWLGLDTRTFYKRATLNEATPSIIAMARPGTPYRGFDTLISALEQLAKLYPDLKITLFGDDLSPYNLPFKYTNAGVVVSTDVLAELYSDADIFIESSHFQGFGRTALEAMACGTACILTNNGGVGEYAENMHNSIMIEPKSSQQIIDAAATLINDKELRKRLGTNAITTAQDFDLKFEAKKTLALLTSWRG